MLKSLRNLCVLCASAVKRNEDARKPQRRRERRGYAEFTGLKRLGEDQSGGKNSNH
jgi:hypothetical protein